MSKQLFKLNKKLSQGFVTLQKVEGRDLDALITSQLTPNFIFLHFGLGTETDFTTVKKFIKDIGISEKDFLIDIYPGYAHGFVEFSSIDLVQQFLSHVQKLCKVEEIKTDSNFKNLQRIDNLQANKVYFDRTVTLGFEEKERNVFFFNTNLKSSDMLCGGGQANSLASACRYSDKYKDLGLVVANNALSEEEEEIVLNNIKDGKWENLSHRRVQHYGFRFIYGANSINPDQKDGELADWVKLPLKFLKDLELPEFDQCTVNDYKPGDGIPPHIDSHAPFEEELVSISLLSDIVMTFKNTETKEEFSILLPRRSAVLLKGEIRYLWTHTIATRKVDRVENDLLFRRQRISLTYRKSKKEPFCDCKYVNACDYSKKQPETDKMGDMGLDFEKKYVKDVYNSIAEHFSHTRYKPWPRVKTFMDSLPKHSIVGDIGCGNGKYLFCTPDLTMIGTDIAESFAMLCKTKDKTAQTLVTDTTSIPFRNNSLDYAISIAVIHHLSTDERRKQAIYELLRVIKKGGRCLIYVWAFEQAKKFGAKDVFVPWNNQPKFENENSKETDKEFDEKKNTIVYKRYYHLFEKGELEKLVHAVSEEFKVSLEIVDLYYDHENWCVDVKKLAD